jgi:succinate-semialdehyde dehydrogenase/glutarate-semialdehyde dehydrogenase
MSFQTINPATGETLRTFPMASGTEVAIALKTADDRYNNDWKLRPVAARAQIVKRAPRCSDRMPASTPAI